MQQKAPEKLDGVEGHRPLAVALRESGAQLIASGRIPVQAILASLEAAEADD